MKTLKESLLDDIDAQIDDQTSLFEDWIKENYIINGKLKIHGNIVDLDGSMRIKPWSKLTQLTNGYFKFGEITGNFVCSMCDYLITLDGGPEYVGGNFNCSYCYKLTSLKGAPKEIDGNFIYRYCKKLKDIKDMPKVKGEIYK